MIPYVNATSLPMPAGSGVKPGSGPENEGAAFPELLSAAMSAESRPPVEARPQIVHEKPVHAKGNASGQKQSDTNGLKTEADFSQKPEASKQQVRDEVTNTQSSKAVKTSGEAQTAASSADTASEAKTADKSADTASEAKTENASTHSQESTEKSSQTNGNLTQSAAGEAESKSVHARSTGTEEVLLKNINAEKGENSALKQQPLSQAQLHTAKQAENSEIKGFSQNGSQPQTETTVPKSTETAAVSQLQTESKTSDASELPSRKSEIRTEPVNTQLSPTEMKTLKSQLLSGESQKEPAAISNLKEQPMTKIPPGEILRNQTPDQNRITNTTENRSFQQMQQNTSAGLSENGNRSGSENSRSADINADKKGPQALNQNPLMREDSAKQLAETLLVRGAAGKIKMKTVISSQPQAEANVNNGEKQIGPEKSESAKLTISRNDVMAAVSSANREINARPEENISRQNNAKESEAEPQKRIEVQNGANSASSENANQESAFSQGKNAPQNPSSELSGKAMPLFSDKMDIASIFGNRFASQIHEMEQTARTSTVERVTQTIATASASRITHAQISVNGKELGQIQIRYEENSANIQKVTLLMESETAKQSIQKQIPQILENLQAKGISLENIETRVNDGRDNASAEKRFYERQQFQARREQNAQFQKSAENPISEQVVIRQFGYNTIEYTA